MDVDTQPASRLPCGWRPNATGPLLLFRGWKEHPFGRAIVEEHADLCLEAGINFEGINLKWPVGQWEFQIFAKGAKHAGDELWVARYLRRPLD